MGGRPLVRCLRDQGLEDPALFHLSGSRLRGQGHRALPVAAPGIAAHMPLDSQFRTILGNLEAAGALPLVRGDAAQTLAHYRKLSLSRRGPEFVSDQAASAAGPARLRSPAASPPDVPDFYPLSEMIKSFRGVFGFWEDLGDHSEGCQMG